MNFKNTLQNRVKKQQFQNDLKHVERLVKNLQEDDTPRNNIITIVRNYLNTKQLNEHQENRIINKVIKILHVTT